MSEANTAALTEQKKTGLGTMVAFGFGDFGTNFVWSFVSSFITLYYTDSVGLSAAFAGTMMLICRLLDGGSDVLMGVILERTNTKLGKSRPWFIASILPLAVSMLLLFNVPESLSIGGKQLYAYLTYIFMAVFCYTASNLSYNSLLTRFTYTAQERSKASAVRMFITIVAIMLVNMGSMSFIGMLGGINDPTAWKKLALIYAVICFVSQCITGIFVKEHISEEELNAQQTKEKQPLGPAIKAVLSTKYFWITLGLFLCMYIHSGLIGINVYYARDILGNEGLFAPMSLCLLGTVFILQPFVPSVVKKIGKRKFLMVGACAFAISGIIIQFLPQNAPLTLVAFFIRGIGQGCFMGQLMTCPADLIVYVDRKTGLKTEGFSWAACSIGLKVGTGLGSAIVGWLLAAGHYDASLTVQSAATKSAMTFCAGASYIILGIVMFILLCFLDYSKEAVMQEGDLA